jgi:hypothetical protein
MYLAPQLIRPRGGTYYLGTPLSIRAKLPLPGHVGAFGPRPRTDLYVRSLGFLGQPINASGQAAVNASAAAGQIVRGDGSPIYVPGTKDCAHATSVGKALITAGASTAGGLLLKMGAASGNPIVLAAGGAAELAGVIFGAIFGHHQAAVGREQNVLCSAVPAANDSFAVIDQAVQSGQFTPQQGMDALDKLAVGFQSAVQPILKMDSRHCNAACVMTMAMKAVVAAKKAAYSALAAQQQAAQQQAAAAAAAAQQQAAAVVQSLPAGLQPIGTAVSSVIAPVQAAIASAGLPSWVLPAAGLLFLYEAVK